MTDIDYYDVLGCTKNSTYEELKRAYHAKLLESHPDKTGSNDDTDEVKQVVTAWKILSQPELRKEYDSQIRQAELEMNSHLIYATINESELQSSFDNSNTLVYPCRCGSMYYVDKNYLKTENSLIYVDCFECTFTLAVQT